MPPCLDERRLLVESCRRRSGVGGSPAVIGNPSSQVLHPSSSKTPNTGPPAVLLSQRCIFRTEPAPAPRHQIRFAKAARPSRPRRPSSPDFRTRIPPPSHRRRNTQASVEPVALPSPSPANRLVVDTTSDTVSAFRNHYRCRRRYLCLSWTHRIRRDDADD